MTTDKPAPAPQDVPASSDPTPAEAATRVVRSEELFHGQREIHILHGQEVYRLVITRAGKLLLQK